MKRSALFELKDRGWRNCHRAVDLGLPELRHLPLELQVEVTTACNLRCSMCTRTWNRPKSRHLPYAVLQRILPILPHATRLIPFGLGEPLLYPHFMELVESAKSSGVTVSFNTNGTLMSRDVCRRFVALGVDAIGFSIDGASQEVFEEIRAGAGFRQVVDNIEFLCSERNRRGTGNPQVIVSFVPMKRNVHELPKLISLCGRIGVTDLCFESLLAPAPDWNPGYQAFHSGNALSNVSSDELQDLADRCEALARASRVSLHPPGFLDQWRRRPETPAAGTSAQGPPPPGTDQETSRGGGGVECTLPWTTIYVSVSGVVQTCCMSARVLGNLNDQDLEEIWHGEAFQSYRREMAERRFPEECATCLANRRNRRNVPDLLRPVPRPSELSPVAVGRKVRWWLTAWG